MWNCFCDNTNHEKYGMVRNVGDMNFYDDLDKYCDRIAIITEAEEQISYQKLLETADKLAGFIRERSLVFLVCKNTFESVAAYVGFLRKRIVTVLINSEIESGLFSTLLESYHPNFISCPKDWMADGNEVYGYGEYRILQTDYNQKHELFPELALLLTTSGSTGSPKLVRQSYQNIISNANSIAQYLAITSEDRPITTLPMNYTFGLSILNSHLLVGASIIMTEATLMDKRFWNLIKTQRATTFSGVPYSYEILKKLRFARMDLPSMRYMTQAGGKLTKELSAEFTEVCAQKGIEFIVMYGQTEASPRMSYLPWKYAKDKEGSIGLAIPGGKFSLNDIDGNVINDSEVIGELVYSGENVTLGYAQSWKDLCKGDENGGVLHTGDMAKRDSDGFYYIVGRKKRFLKLFGNRVNLDEVEGLLKTAGYECVCAGVDDHLKIYLTDEDKIEEARSFISQKTGLNFAGFMTISIKEIPRNEAGKVLYSKLEELYG